MFFFLDKRQLDKKIPMLLILSMIQTIRLCFFAKEIQLNLN